MPRKKRGGYIYRRKGKFGWYAFLDKHHKHISLKTDDEEEAQTRLAEMLVSRRLRALAPNDKPIAEVFEECLTRAKTNHTQKYTYGLGLNSKRIVTWLEERGITSTRAVSLQLVEDYKTSRRFTVGAARINSELTTWKKAMKIAIDWKVFPRDGLECFVKLREPRPQPHQRGLTKAEIDRFLRNVNDAGYRAMFRLMIGTGMRDDEMRHMDASDLQPPVIVVTPKPGWTTKGYRYRSIPVTKQTLKAARDFLAARPKLNMDQKGIWSRIQKACKVADVPPFSLHDLRRAWASHMLKAGNSLQNISRWLGHADIMTTMRYLRVVDAEMPTKDMLPF